MSLRSMRKAARLAASDTRPLRTQRSRFGIESGSDRESKIVMRSRIQDHHGVGIRREAIGCSPHVHRSQRRLRNSVLSGRFRCMSVRAVADFAVPSVVRGRPAEEPILRRVGGVLIMSRRTDVADVPAVLYGVEEAAAALRLSRSVLYELIRSGQLRTVKQGRRRLLPVPALAEYVASLESGIA
jgi:excisionase family DNA binding protein